MRDFFNVTPEVQNVVLHRRQGSRQTEKLIIGCEACSDSAQIHFDWILADVVNLHCMSVFVMDAPVKCPLCHAPVSRRWSIVAGLKSQSNYLQGTASESQSSQ